MVWTRVLSPADPVKRLLSPGAKLPDEDTAEHADGEESSEAPTPRKLSRGGSGRKSHAVSPCARFRPVLCPPAC